jgi:hypothetical protein
VARAIFATIDRCPTLRAPALCPGFRHDPHGIAAEGIVNARTVVIADFDLGTLGIQHQSASVRPLLDRRHGLYELAAKVPVEHVTVV